MPSVHPTRSAAATLLSALVALALLLPTSAAARAPGRAATAPALELYTLGLLGRGVTWSAERTPHTDSLQAGHLANIRRLFAAGKLVAAGPFAGDGDRRGLFVFRLDSLDDLPALLAGDPAIQAGRLRLDTYRLWAAPGLGRAYRERSEREPAARDSMVTYSFVLLRRGPAWTANLPPAVRRLLDRHQQNIQRLTREGSLILAGPVEGTGDLRGVFIFDADTVTTRRLLAGDPAIKAGRFVPEIHAWWTAWGVVPGH
jgi:uncharacterized protein YciI